MKNSLWKRVLMVLGIGCGLAVSAADLPEVMVLGDSIRMNYLNEVRQALQGKATVWAPMENCQDTTFYRENLEKWCQGRQPKVIHFNVGLHDIYLNRAGQCRHTPEQYGDSLKAIYQFLHTRFPQAKIIFATSTPVDEEKIVKSKTYGRLVRRNADIDRYNALAVKLLTASGASINDLNTLVKKHGGGKLLLDDGTHLNQAGKKLLGQAVAARIGEALK